ncbi:MAG: SCO family protein [Solirubrobacteraceae bacterium]|jgi:protein SCO1/2
MSCTVRRASARWLLVVALGACLALLSAQPSHAIADGDPASDVLPANAYFVPADANVQAAEQEQLGALLARAKRSGIAIRVAVIPTSYDLGSALGAWRKPQAYAEFLGYELQNSFKSLLLVVMPNGFGVNWPGHDTASLLARLSRVPIRSGRGGMIAATDAGVRAAAAAAGITLGAQPASSSGSSSGVPTIVPIIVGIWALLLVLVAAVLRRRRAPTPRQSQRGTVLGMLRARPTLTRLVLLEGAGLTLAIAAGVTLIILKTQAAQSNSPTSTPNAAFVFGARARPAPAFRLTNQAGRTVSLAAYRGKPVIVTFIDPLCRNLCPLAAHVLNEVDQQLPRARRVPIVAVSVDVYADTRADLLEDFSRWSLVPQWEWGVGLPAQLAKVWQKYEVGVSVTTKRHAGIVEHIIQHDEVAYVIDPRGYERALFAWPYTAQSVEQMLARVSQTAGT